MGCIGDVDCAVHQRQAGTVQLPKRIEEYCAATAAVPSAIDGRTAYISVADGIRDHRWATKLFISAADVNRVQLMDIVVVCADDFLGLCFHVDRIGTAI